jgi:predicted nucleic acid-binding protein
MLTTVEMFSLLARRQREGILTVSMMRRLGRAFLKHVKTEYLVFPLDDPLLSRARNILINRPLRTLDAIQLACAWEATVTLNEPLIFISADQNLLSIAGAEGFPTDNPNSYP